MENIKIPSHSYLVFLFYVAFFCFGLSFFYISTIRLKSRNIETYDEWVFKQSYRLFVEDSVKLFKKDVTD